MTNPSEQEITEKQLAEMAALQESIDIYSREVADLTKKRDDLMSSLSTVDQYYRCGDDVYFVETIYVGTSLTPRRTVRLLQPIEIKQPPHNNQEG